MLDRRVLSGLLLAVGLLCVPSVAWAQAAASAYTSGYRWDAMHRLVGTIAPDPDGSGSLRYAAARYTYDVDGNLTKAETGELSAWEADRDSGGVLVAPSSWGSTFTVLQTMVYSYDGAGQKIGEELIGSDGTAKTLTETSYDANGRAQCVAQRMNPAVYATLIANETGSGWTACTLGTEGSGSGDYGPDRITKTFYTMADQIYTMQKPYGTSLNQRLVTYTYTPDGKQQFVTDQNGNVARFCYTGLDRLWRWFFPSKTTTGQSSAADDTDGTTPNSCATNSTSDYEHYSYDANGNKTQTTLRDGNTIGYVYDAMNRMTEENPGGSATPNVDYAYDLMGRQVSALFDSSGYGFTNSYDGAGRLTQVVDNMAVDNTVSPAVQVAYTIKYGYDADGNRTSLTYPDNLVVSYGYDGLNRVNAIKQSTTTLASYTYDRLGHRSGITRGNGTTTSYGYDVAGRLQTLAHNLDGSTTTNDYSATFAYDPAGGIVQRTQGADVYSYGGAYNVTRGYTPNKLNQYAGVGSYTFTYDARGNLTSDGSVTFAYDVENRLITASGNKTATLHYDPVGRLRNTDGGSAGYTYFLHDGDNLLAEYSGNTVKPALLRRYVPGPGVDEPLIWYEGTGTGSTPRRYLYPDNEGSIVAVADNGGATLHVNTYDPWGVAPSDNMGRYQYTGQILLPEVGLYHYKARLYSATLGRFMQTDPVGYKDQINLYGYVGNDPVNGVDPSGQTCVIANGWSNYCMRAYEYAGFDSALGGSTRFFGAASMTTRMLADLDMPIGNHVVSASTRTFMAGLSGDLQKVNESEALAIEHGTLGGGNLDARLVHNEQTIVQNHLDAFSKSDPSGYSTAVGEVNGLLNGKNAASALGGLYSDDSHYQSVLNGVRKGLGRDIDFSRQGDREAIGNALVKDLRASGACTVTGSRIPTC